MHSTPTQRQCQGAEAESLAIDFLTTFLIPERGLKCLISSAGFTVVRPELACPYYVTLHEEQLWVRAVLSLLMTVRSVSPRKAVFLLQPHRIAFSESFPEAENSVRSGGKASCSW